SAYHWDRLTRLLVQAAISFMNGCMTSLGGHGGRNSCVIWFGKIFGLDSFFPEKFIFIRNCNRRGKL
ncbi:MAG: hypothetical protein WA460_06445, partial [Nitrososphaeraceae archaeon]